MYGNEYCRENRRSVITGLFQIHANLLNEIIDNLLLIRVDPACNEKDDEPQAVCHGGKDARINNSMVQLYAAYIAGIESRPYKSVIPPPIAKSFR